MPDIGQIKGTNIKRGNSGLDPKIFDPNKELLDAMRIIAKQEIEKASRDITKNALVRSVNSDGSVNITLEGREFNNIPNYTVGTVKENDVVKVTYPQNQASNMYVSGGTNIDEITNKLSKCVTLSDTQNITNKTYNGMGIYRVSTSNKSTLNIKCTTSNPSEAHVGGLLAMEQNGPALLAILTPSGWSTSLNDNGWSCTYSGSTHQWTIKAGNWSGGWFFPFSNYTYSVSES